MKRFHPVTLNLLLLSLVISACGSALPDVTHQPESSSPIARPEEPSPASTPFAAIETSQPPDIVRDEPIGVEMIGRAITDLAERLGIPENEVRVIDVKEVTWPDASLGCPQPEMAYAQVTTPGYRIVLETSGEQYPFHTNLGTNIVLCQEESLPLSPVKPGEINDSKPWMPIEPIQPGAKAPK